MDERSAIKELIKKKAKGYIIKLLLPIIPCILAVAVVFVLFIVVIFAMANKKKNNSNGFGNSWTNEISGIGEYEIPSQFLDIYKEAEGIYQVPWNILAAIHKVETSFSTDVTVSSAGAIGHMQFMPKTWVGWSYPSKTIPDHILKDPEMIAKYGGYGVDADLDGYADPWSLEDAIYSAAHYLSKSGASTGDYRKAVFAYNHANWYVDKVMNLADSYVNSSTGHIDAEYTGNGVVDVGMQWIGRSKYSFGGGRNSSDVGKGYFDCSSFVYWAFEQNDVVLGSRGSVSTQTLNKLGDRVSIDTIEVGDLVFFDTYQKDGHVVIYMGDNKAIGCQGSTNGVGIIDMGSTYWKSVFKGHVRRI